MPEEVNYYGLVNKPPIDEITNLDLVNKPDINSDELTHWGILKMKWGVRRYQNEDGTLTELGKQRLREKRNKIEKAEAKKRIKEEKREARAKARRAKSLANPDPKWLEKNMHKYTNDELYKAMERVKIKKDIEDIQKERMDIAKHKVDTIIHYGDSINNTIKFLNSDAGKGIRKKLGFSTATIWNFKAKEDEKDRLNRKKEEWEDYQKKDKYKRAADMEDWQQKDLWRRDRNFEDKVRDDAYEQWLKRRYGIFRNGGKGKGGKK